MFCLFFHLSKLVTYHFQIIHTTQFWKFSHFSIVVQYKISYNNCISPINTNWKFQDFSSILQRPKNILIVTFSKLLLRSYLYKNNNVLIYSCDLNRLKYFDFRNENNSSTKLLKASKILYKSLTNDFIKINLHLSLSQFSCSWNNF